MPIDAEAVPIVAADGYRLGGRLFAPAGSPESVALLASAMGVPQTFYARFAEYLAEAGIATLTFDYRGIAESRPATLRGFPARLQDWADLDLTAAAKWLQRRFPGTTFLWIGHSVGGQLLGLMDRVHVDAALFVAGQSGYWRHWSGAGRVMIASLWHLLIPTVVPLVGYLPFRAARMGENVPAGVAFQWAKWGRHPEYVLSEARARGGAYFARFAGPLLLLGIADDGFAPRRAVEALASYYTAARLELRFIHPSDIGEKEIGHFGFFRSRSRESLWAPALAWLREAAARAASSHAGEARGISK
jgi:predicted alpha/beta hydrolase